jgi:hypothetical protein
MDKAIISKRDLDALIRMHLVNIADDCGDVTPMPVVWRARARHEPNWAIPGWNGDSKRVRRCVERLRQQLSALRRQYDIPDEQ